MLNNEFWQNEEKELWNVIASLFVDTLMDGVRGGIELLPPDIAILIDLDVVNQAAIDYARQYRYEWIGSITDTTRNQVQTLFSDWIETGRPLKALEAELAPVFGRARAQMIASTEVTRVFADANQAAWESTGFVGGKQWMTSRDDKVCPICAPLGELPPVALNNAFPAALGGGYRNPPAHTRCRCWIQPIVSVEAVLQQSRRRLGLE